MTEQPRHCAASLCPRKRRRAAGRCLPPRPRPPHAAPRPPGHLAQRALCLAAAGAIIFALFYGGSQPPVAGLIVAPWDKLAHFAVYGAITVLLWLATGGRAPLAVIAVVIATGALDELHQVNVPGRAADIIDFLIDGAGAAVAGTVMLWLEGGSGRFGRMARAVQPSGG